VKNFLKVASIGHAGYCDVIICCRAEVWDEPGPDHLVDEVLLHETSKSAAHFRHVESGKGPGYDTCVQFHRAFVFYKLVAHFFGMSSDIETELCGNGQPSVIGTEYKVEVILKGPDSALYEAIVVRDNGWERGLGGER
jgi:hypothetical protein